MTLRMFIIEVIRIVVYHFETNFLLNATLVKQQEYIN